MKAMAMRKPVVATNVSGSKELVLPGETGYLADVADVQGLALALEDLAADCELRRRMGEAGRARAWEHYDLRRMIRDVEQIYRELLYSRREVASERRASGIAALKAEGS